MSNVIIFPTLEPPVPPVPSKGPAPRETGRARGISRARALVALFDLEPWDVFPELAIDEGEVLDKTIMKQNSAVQQRVKNSSEADHAQGRAVALVLRKVADIQAAGPHSVKAACQTLIRNARAGLLPSALMNNLRTARDKRGRSSPDGLPSVRALELWVLRERRGESLVPKQPQPNMVLCQWMMTALELKRGPQKPTTKMVHEQLVTNWIPAWGDKPPSYDQVIYFFKHKSMALT